jgi:hypothetical protein
MQKVVILIISIVILCVGCATKENQPYIESTTQITIPENETIISLSPNSRYRAEAYGTNKNITAAGLYPYEGIRIVDVENSEVLFKMPGYYVIDFDWSPDGRYVGIYYEARIYGESIVFDTKDRESILLPKLEDIALNYGENEKPQENRPDPYFHIVEWKDEETVVIDFRWNRENIEPFSGRFNFNINTHKVSYK